MPDLKVLIVEHEKNLGRLWLNQLTGDGLSCSLVRSQRDAIQALDEDPPHVVVLDMELRDGSALAVADYARDLNSNIKVVFVTAGSFFSDGTLFEFMENACAMVPLDTPATDISAIVAYHGR